MNDRTYEAWQNRVINDNLEEIIKVLTEHFDATKDDPEV
jgi:hypothetical protein